MDLHSVYDEVKKTCNRCDKHSWFLWWNDNYGAFICGKCCNEVNRGEDSCGYDA